MSFIFETDRLRVEPYTKADCENFFRLNGNETVVRYIRPVKTREECACFLKQVIADAEATPLYGRWAVRTKQENLFVGSFAVIPVEKSDEMQLGYALLPDFWGMGFATELTRAGIGYVFRQTPLSVIHAYADIENIPSQKVLLKSGFRLVGRKPEGERELARFSLEKGQFMKATGQGESFQQLPSGIGLSL